MANVYGSTLDSLMQNDAAQQASAQNERNSYRNYLNQIANTNLRRREGDSLDAYRRGDIDVRRIDANSMGDYRRGLITNDLNRIGAQERLGTLQSNNQYNLGLDTNRTSLANVNRQAKANEYISDNALSGQKYVSDNVYNLGLDTNRTAITNVGRQAQAQENVATTGANASMYNAGVAANANMYNADRMYDTASLPYNKLTAPQQKIYDQFGAQGLMPQDQNVRAIQAAAQTERDTADRAAMRNLMNQYDAQWQADDYGTDWFKDQKTKEINREIDAIAAEQGITDDSKKQSLYGTALQRVVGRKFSDLTPNQSFRIQSMTPGSADSMGGTNSVPAMSTNQFQLKARNNTPYSLIR